MQAIDAVKKAEIYKNLVLYTIIAITHEPMDLGKLNWIQPYHIYMFPQVNHKIGLGLKIAAI